ncbi:GGDEF domain-containing protein [Nocardia sp. CDC159]|uniref:GGDEF domain-containing protein n=1 Tax=Nocardia pulmonis TaxID=2951408 RepID=A0A9X2EDL1_9NOCA|nr:MULTISPECIES: GGDEF domain-containing protein [Nocardia]MCM6776278.1 GGDEF domain-containing protein [Nocardia pulmonis]MCM6788702.1 GGDEF domain-containing protein [Nocardia sp. CDC159]
MVYRKLIRSWWTDEGRQHLLVKTIAAHSVLAAMRAVVCSGGAVGAVAMVSIAFSAAGTERPEVRVAALICAVAALWWFVRWLFRPWPGRIESTVVLACSDLIIGAVCLVSADAMSKATGYFLLTIAGVYCVFLHNAKVLTAHAAWSIACVIGTAMPLLAGERAIFAVAVMVMAVVINVVMLPGMQFNFWLLWTDLLSDPLTKLWTRRGMQFHSAAMIARGDRTPLCAIVIDLDRFKAVNDRAGHGAGDEVLRHTADALRAVAPARTLIARTGGEEFAVLGRLCAADGYAAAERLRRAIADSTSPNAVTASIGVALTDIDSARGDSARRVLAEIVNRADAAMYRAKQRGGNAVEQDHGEVASPVV